MIRERRSGPALGLLALVLACAVALATPTQSTSVGIEPGLDLNFRASVAPRAVSASTPTPVTLTFAASPRQSDGSVASGLRSLTLDLDRKFSFDFGGRPTCSFGRAIRAPFPPSCRKAIVGRGRLAGAVAFPDQESVPFDVPTTVFKTGEGGDTTLGLFALVRNPVTFTLLRPLSLHRRGDGPFGYRVTLTIPPIANGVGVLGDLSATIGLPRRGNLGGTLTMQCSPDRVVRIRARAELDDGTQLEAQESRACNPVG
jgi:hypothetical protein